MSVSPSAEPTGEFGLDAREFIEGEALGDPEVGLAPAVVERDALDPGRLAIALAVACARSDGLVTMRVPGARVVASSRASSAAAALPASSSGGSLRPQYRCPVQAGRCVPDQDDAGHVRPARTRRATSAPSGPEIAADSNVAIPSRNRTAAAIRPMARAAPVPSPSRRSRSSSGRRSRCSRTTA